MNQKLKQKTMKSNIKDFRKKLIKTYSILFRIMIFFKISQIEITDKNVWKNDDDYNYRIKEFNLYNPLTYLPLIIMIILSILVDGISGTFNNFGQHFKYK